jgi:hypothetical protein
MSTLSRLLTIPIPQPQAYHNYADRREWLGVPYAANVLSNFPVALVGFRALVQNQSNSRKLMGYGLVAAAIGSAFYHWAPDDERLAADRLGMSVAIAGAMGWATEAAGYQQVAPGVTIATLAASIGSIIWWRLADDVKAYAVVQALATVAYRKLARRAKRRERVRLMMIYRGNMIAKLCEMLDHRIWHATRQTVSGHTLKHLFLAAGFVTADLILAYTGASIPLH